jgi:hypothetical protein
MSRRGADGLADPLGSPESLEPPDDAVSRA